jgi:hypothetical protein
MTRRRRWLGVLAIPVLLAALVDPGAASATPTTAGPVSASGTSLVVAGKPWEFVGYNMPCAQPFGLNAQQLQFAMADIADNSSANALRVWFFQKNGGPGNWAPFDQVVAAAQAAGIRLIPTLVNEWAACENDTTQKSLTWFQRGYKQPGDGYPLSYRDFAVAVAQHYAGNPTVAFWQLINEATAPTAMPNGKYACDETAAAHAVRAFADDMTTAIHAVDPHHLVSLGTQGGDQCGTTGADYGYVHAGAVNLCEFHDYSPTYIPIAADHTPNGLADDFHQCQSLHKPFFVGEAGIVPNVQPPPAPEPVNCGPWPKCSPVPVTQASLDLRAQTFQGKITNAFASGISGYLIWFKFPQYSAVNDSYAIGDGDPTEAMMASLTLGTNTQITVPPISNAVRSVHHRSWTDSPILLVVGGAVLIVLWIAIWRVSRRRPVLTDAETPSP